VVCGVWFARQRRFRAGDLVWRKILTAPDASSMNIYEDGERSGFCEFSTSVEMEMAKLDEDKRRRKESSPAPATRST